MPVARRRTVATISTAILALTLAASASATARVEGLRETSSSTFRLLPDQGVVRAESVITIVNRKKPTKSRGPCKNKKRKTCRITTTYFVDSWSSIWVPPDAEDLAIIGKRVKPELLGTNDTGSAHDVTFPRLDFKEKQKLVVRYDLPAGQPGSPGPTRIADGYARFCWSGEFTDTGSVKAVLPPGWEAVTTMSATKSEVSTDGTTTLLAAGKKLPGAFYACTDAFQKSQQGRIYILGPSEQVVTLDHWPNDEAWREALLDTIGGDLRRLEATIGSPMPFAALTINEVARTDPFGSAADFLPDDARLFIDEGIGTPGVATVALARTWFNEKTVADPWLREGLARWAGRSAIDGTCPDAGDSPSDATQVHPEWIGREGKPFLWDHDRLAWQGAQACNLVADVAGSFGPAGMTRLITFILHGPRFPVTPTLATIHRALTTDAP